MNEPLQNDPAVPRILLAMTVVTGMVDAVSFLALGRVFTANMTGNVVLLGFAVAGVPGLSITRSVLALAAFMFGAVGGGRMATRAGATDSDRWVVRGFYFESVLLLASAALSLGSLKVEAVVVLTAAAMGLRNAVIRKLAVPDLTTTVLTMTITGLAADSSLAGGSGVRWKRRVAAILALPAGAFAGALMLRYSATLPLCVCGVVSALCAFTLERQRRQQ